MGTYEDAVKRYERERSKTKEEAVMLENKKKFLIKVLKYIINESGRPAENLYNMSGGGGK